MPKLCVNIDHVATVRQARLISEPDPVHAAILAEAAGAAGITCHLREDRRHIQDADVFRLKDVVKTHLNLEMAVTQPMLEIAEKVQPHMVMFVPENRQEITTEGGLNVAGKLGEVKSAVKRMHEAGLLVSIFIDPDLNQIDAARECEADIIELHTGAYSEAKTEEEKLQELMRLEAGAVHASMNEQRINAGHGLNLRNILPVAAIKNLQELHIGHSIVSHAVMVGFESAVREMISAIRYGESLSSRYTPEQILQQFAV